jgi:large subunit ribosomal protein L15
MRLNTLAPRPGAKHRRKRLGCGESSGHGKTSGKGHKGQNSRSGGSIRIGFEGGQMPMHRRLPKKGFNNSAFGFKWAVVNLTDLEIKFADGDTVNEESLRAHKLVKGGAWDGVKILSMGDLTKKLTVAVDRISALAKEKIEKAGGTVTLNALKVGTPKPAV